MPASHLIAKLPRKAWLAASPACQSNTINKPPALKRHFSESPQAWLIHDGSSLRLQHGPIDLILSATGSSEAVQKAYLQANNAFQQVLTTLVTELPQLRRPVAELKSQAVDFDGPVAQGMVHATGLFGGLFVTPMAAVAGAVADHIRQAALENNPLDKLLVNNGGDISIYLSAEKSCRVGICNNLELAQHDDVVTLHSGDDVGGIATSGWQGRSQSLGIADAVTVLARNAAVADAAATLITNAVDLPDSPHVHRKPANTIQCDSDLADRLVTVGVDQLSIAQKTDALERGALFAKGLQQQGLIQAVYISLQGATEIVAGSWLAKQSLETRNCSRP